MDDLFPHGGNHYLTGGLLIGAGVSLLFVTTGFIGGQSSFFSAVCSWFSRASYFRNPKLVASRYWRVVYALGLVLGAAIFVWAGGSKTVTHVPIGRLVAGGFLVGFGARLGGGCTSGHGICGLASLQMPSLLAVLTFLGTAMVTVRLVAHFSSGALP
jgi:uncharacterized membrane protein YedE/YeeE